MGCDQSLPSIKNRTRCNTTAILDQYKRKLYRKTIYRKSKPTNKKRNRAIDRRKSNPERNQIRTNIQRTRQHDRKSLECTFRNRLPYQTGKTTRKDENRLKDFCKAFEEGDAQAIEQQFTQYLIKTISIRDTFTSKKENFYHGVLLGLLSYDPDWYITSNTESGDGYSDIMIEVEHKQMGIVIEIKYAENVKALDQACEKALKQIKEKHYDQKLEEEGYETILNYGIACYKKRCKVLLQEKK